MSVDVDLLMIGAGPVGLYGAYYAGFRGLHTALMDSLPEPGGQITAMYPEKPIFDVAGFPMIKGRNLVDNLVAQADRFDPRYLLGEQASTLVRRDDDFEITSAQGTVVHARAVIISGGIGTFTPRPLPTGSEYADRGLSYFVPRLADHAGNDVVIVGGGDSAFDWAMTLHPIARSVTLVHRRAAFRAHAQTVAEVRALGVEIIINAQIAAVRGAERVEEVEVVVDGVSRTLPAQTLIAALGFLANLGPIKEWGIEVVAHRFIPVTSAMETVLPRVYAAGDITDYPGKVRLISVGFGEVATAVNNAAVAIDPSVSLFPGHSSENAVPV